MMKLAFCLFNYFPYGGLQRDFLRIAALCKARGHEVHLYTMSVEGELDPDFHLHIINARGFQNHTRIAHFVKQLTAALAENHYDLVIGFNKMPNLDCYYAADVCYQARMVTRGLAKWLPRYRQYVSLENSVFAKGLPTDILLISALQQPLFTHYYQTESSRFHLLPPGIMQDRKAPLNADLIRAQVRKEYAIGQHDFLLLSVGSGFKTKGLDRTLQALAALPSALRARCHLFVIGQDNSQPFKTLAKQLALSSQVQFLGGRSDVPQFLLAADLLMHPAYHENTGTVLLEAVCAGLPVLTVDICGYAHYIDQAQAGMVLSSPFQQTQLNMALQTLLLSMDGLPAAEVTWRQNSLKFADNADIYSMPEKAVALIEGFARKKVAVTNYTKQQTNYYHPHLLPYFSTAKPLFEQMMALTGEVFRNQKGRVTQRLSLGEKSYFIKQHQGVGWLEIIKNVMQVRLPIISAKNEWQAIAKLNALGIHVPKVVAFGERGMNPAKRQSFVLMEALTETISLEELGHLWQKKPPHPTFKRALITEVAMIARTLHLAGLNHRDFYICHFLLNKRFLQGDWQHLSLHLIDLHRTQIRSKTPLRWIIKDLASLYFSSTSIGLTQRDFYRFMKVYHQQSLRELFCVGNNFWQKVKKRGDTYRDHTK